MLFSSLQNVNDHYLMINKYYSPYFILAMEGVISFSLYLGYFIIDQFVPQLSEDHYFSFINEAKYKI